MSSDGCVERLYENGSIALADSTLYTIRIQLSVRYSFLEKRDKFSFASHPNFDRPSLLPRINTSVSPFVEISVLNDTHVQMHVVEYFPQPVHGSTNFRVTNSSSGIAEPLL